MNDSASKTLKSIFADFKPVRNRIADLDREDALRVIWAYGMYLQFNEFVIPKDIEVNRKYYEHQFPRGWIAEWSLEILAKEILLYCGAVSRKGKSLRQWAELAIAVNGINKLENAIYGVHGSSNNVLIEMIRIGHRIFGWQGNPPNHRTIMRFYKIFNTTEISKICERLLGLSVMEVYACTVAMLGFFLDRHAINLPVKSEIQKLPAAKFETFLDFVSCSLPAIKQHLKQEQKYDENFAYAYSSLRARPIIVVPSINHDMAICPLPTLLYWRTTSGLFYDLMREPTFANYFGDSFQVYVGEVLEAGCPSLTLYDEELYRIGNSEKRSIDWIIEDTDSAVFVECKVKRMTWAAKATLTDLSSLETDIGHIADAVVQVYKTIDDHISGHYPHFPYSDLRKIYPCVVTLEEWHMHGIMLEKINEQVEARLLAEGLPVSLLESMPYSICAIEEFEGLVQVINQKPIGEVFDGKLKNKEMREWQWHSYLLQEYRDVPMRALFNEEYKDLFVNLKA